MPKPDHTTPGHSLSLGNTLEYLAAGVLIADGSGTLTFTNSRARTYLGLRDQKADGNLGDILTSASLGAMKSAMDRILGGEARCHTEEFVRDGRTYLGSIGPGPPEGLTLVIQDVSELKEAEAQHLQTSKMSAVGQLAAGVAHEFNNLIAGIYGYAQFMREHPEEEVVQKGVDVILRSSERARELTASLLTFSRRKSGRREPVDLNQILTDTLLLSHRQLERNRIQVLKQLSTLPLSFADGGKLQQVFLDLILNAQQAMVDGGTIIIESAVADNVMTIRMTDDGPGIALEHIDRIFEPFFTTKGPLGGARVPGTGLGLSSAFNVVRDHGGTLRVVSTPGEGASFTMTLPVRSLHEPARTNERSRRPRSLDRTGRILVVDDDVTLRDLISEILAGLGHETRAVADATQVREELSQWVADMLIIDRMAPGMDRPEVYERLRRKFPELPILFIMDRNAKAGLDSDGDPWMFRLNKPFRNRDLISLVSSVLSQRLDNAS